MAIRTSNPPVLSMLVGALLVAGCKDCGKGDAQPPDSATGREAATAAVAPDTDRGETEGPGEDGVWTRSGRAPADEKLVALLSSDGDALKPVLLGENAELGDGRFLRLVLQGPKVTALVVSENEGEAQIEARILLPIEMLSAAEGPVQPDDPLIEDLDGDGEQEVMLALTYSTHPAGAGGGSHREQKFILDLAPVPRVAFTVLTKVSPTSGAGAVTEASITISDRDDDGRGDIALKGKQCIGKACTPMNMVYYYNPASDSWAEHQ